MNSETIFALIVLITCILAIVLVNSNKKKKNKQFIQTLYDFAEKSNCKISEYDLWNNTLIGIDKQAHKLFFIRKYSDHTIKNEIDLVGIQKGRVINSNRIVENGGSNHTIIDKLELTFASSDFKVADTILEFYNTNRDNLVMNGELPKTEKWAAIVNENIGEINQRK